MKKILLAFAIVMLSISGSFAYQQVLYCNPTIGYAGTTVNINSTCSYITLDCSWSGFFGEYSAGSAVAYGDERLIGEYSWWLGDKAPSYSGGIFTSYYWTTVQMTMSANNCYGEATLEWMP